MKKSIRKILLILLTVTAVICCALGIAACSGVKLESISIENPKTMFLIGDEFEYGENFTVYANYSDGSKEDVTQSVEIRKESGFDMNTPGDYQLTVSYENKREIYTIYVNDFASPLRKIELNTENVKKQFELGESVSLEGLVITSTYENAQGNLITSTSGSLKDLDVEITDTNGNSVETDGVFTSLGEYTVTVSSGSVKDYYTVLVSGINISTVQGALTVGNFYKSEVVSGTQTVREALRNNASFDSFAYEYEYGNNFTRIAESIESKSVQYLSMDSEGIFCVTSVGNKIETNSTVTSEMMNGAPVLLWYYGVREFGIENALTNLYEEAKKCTNKDLKETADEQDRKYSFSFSGLVFRSNDASYFETEVSFSLGAKYNIENVKIEQRYWENNSELSENEDYVPTFTTDDNGITTTTVNFTHKIEVTVKQASGERTAENPYNRNMFRVQSYNLVYNNKVLGDNDTLTYDMGTNTSVSLTFSIEEMLPETSDFVLDPMYISLQGGVSGEQDSTVFLSENGFMAWRRNNILTVQIKRGGTFVLNIRTANTLKTITFDITGNPPTSISPMIYNEAASTFASGNSKLVALNANVYFYGAVNEYANPAQSYTITSDNASSASIQKTTVGGVDCFVFTANKEGEYTVTVTSDSALDKNCTFTFTVSDIPDYEGLLKGNYKAIDLEENIFALSFTPAEGLKGTLAATKTPTELDGTPITSEAKTANYSYSVDVDSLTITLTRTSGDNLGISLTVDASGRLILIDQHNDEYVLETLN